MGWLNTSPYAAILPGTNKEMIMKILQHITLAEAKARCRDAWCRGELSGQHHTGYSGCRYETPAGHKCAIGVCLNPAMLKWATNTDRLNSSRVLALFGRLTTDDQDGLSRLQRLHDNMSMTRTPDSAKRFMAFIYS